MEVERFAEIEEEFVGRAHTMVWCNVATVDGRGRPRSRILHPIWEGGVGWVVTRRHSFKEQHLARNPHVSLAYIANIARPAFADCVASWEESAEAKQRIWDLFRAAPEPLGYDPGTIFASVDAPGSGLLRLEPWRIELGNFPGGPVVWRAR